MSPACGGLFMVSGPTGFVFLGRQSLACLHLCKNVLIQSGKILVSFSF